MKKQYKRALTIAGNDPSGGAGLQADLKTFSACGCYGAAAITLIANGNTLGVTDIYTIPTDFVTKQIKAVLDDIGADAIKIGMLYSSELILAVKKTLANYKIENIVLDPVMVSVSGNKLLEDDAIETLKKELIPRARIITPNLPEAELLLGNSIKSHEDFKLAVRELSFNRSVSVLLKAGHLDEDILTDVFYNAETDEIIELTSERIQTKNINGTGCTLSSAVAAFLARNKSLNDSVLLAKEYVTKAIESGSKYKLGEGNGPVNHFFNFW